MREISSPQNPIVKHFVKLRMDSNYRKSEGTLLVEGEKLIKEIGVPLRILSSKKSDIHANESYITTQKIINKISGVETSEGVIGEFHIPKPSTLSGLNYIVALDRISDPGNMGTIFRTALALGWEGVYILEGSCDPFNDKVTRASKGALFRLPYLKGSWKELKQLIKENKLNALAASMDGTPFSKTKSQQSILLVLGNEAQGISAEAKNICDIISIPMAGSMESLNVAIAGGILMYFLKETL